MKKKRLQRPTVGLWEYTAFKYNDKQTQTGQRLLGRKLDGDKLPPQQTKHATETITWTLHPYVLLYTALLHVVNDLVEGNKPCKNQ